MSEKKTRLIKVEWDNAKIPNLPYDARFSTREAEGVIFENGVVALSNGVVFETLHELETNLKAYGNAEIIYQDKEQSA